jgi:quinol monooxygenase YgiN
MIVMIVTLRVKPGSEAEFESIFADLSKAVRANEPGNLAYQLARTKGEIGTYKVVEIYRDQGAFDAHVAADHSKAASPKLSGVLAGRPDVEFLEGIE